VFEKKIIIWKKGADEEGWPTTPKNSVPELAKPDQS
jgi:hypothetical protein